MEGGGSSVRSSYYNVLGIRKDASVSDIRTAYRKLAMVLHPLLFRIYSISKSLILSILVNYCSFFC